MKKSLLVSLLCVASLCNAQNPKLEVTDTTVENIYDVIDSVFSQLNMAPVTTGLLADKSLSFVKLKDFTGQPNTDTLYNEYNWNALYGTLSRSAIEAQAAPPSPSTWYDVQQGLLNTGTIPIKTLHYYYHASQADSATLYQSIYWDGAYFRDVPNASQSPWVQHTVFAAGLAQSTLYDTLRARFVVHPLLYLATRAKPYRAYK